MLSVVIPVYNSAGTIDELVCRLRLVLDKLPCTYEIIFVNDGSSDTSWETLSKHANEYSNITAINLEKNYGQANAIYCGFSYVRGDYVVTMDDDLQYPAEEIEKLYSAILDDEQLDVVIGMPKERKGSVTKKMGSWMTHQFLYKQKKGNKHFRPSSFRIMKKELVDKLLEYKQPEPYIGALIYLFSNAGKNVYVQHHERKQGKSGYGIRKTINHLLTLITIYATRRATLIKKILFSGIGLLLMMLATDYFFQLDFSAYGLGAHVLYSLISLVCIVSAMLVTLVLLKYAHRLYHLLSNQPQYIIKELKSGLS